MGAGRLLEKSQPNSNTSVACPTFQSSLQFGIDQFSSSAGHAAVEFACAQLGKPYVWGGNGTPGFDCSGLAQAAYAAADIQLPRTAQAQYDAGPKLPAGAPLEAGNLVFFGTASNNITHVGVYVGRQGDQAIMVDAPNEGSVVRVEPFPATVGARWGSDTYIGATAPGVR